jgi:hypothetical protein
MSETKYSVGSFVTVRYGDLRSCKLRIAEINKNNSLPYLLVRLNDEFRLPSAVRVVEEALIPWNEF